jgi:hypothetical protein
VRGLEELARLFGGRDEAGAGQDGRQVPNVTACGRGFDGIAQSTIAPVAS